MKAETGQQLPAELHITLDNCKQLCQETEECVAADFVVIASSVRVCQMYSEVSGSVPTTAAENITFIEKDCSGRSTCKQTSE